jgi:hypothetical protein
MKKTTKKPKILEKGTAKLKSWANCKHKTQIMHDYSDDTEYEVCKACSISRRIK